jgi:hypothetical protein
MTKLIDVSSEAYHKIDRLSSSRLMEFDNDREEYEARFVRKVRSPRGSRDALVVGGALHTLVLEGRETFDAEYALEPKLDARTKAGKAARAEFESAAAGKINPSCYSIRWTIQICRIWCIYGSFS